LWKLREEHSEAQKRAGASIKTMYPTRYEGAGADPPRHRGVRAAGAGHPLRAVRHLGDATSISTCAARGGDADAFLARDHELMDAVNAVVRALDGSFRLSTASAS